MRKIVSFVHVSLDGFVASTAEGPAGLTWISLSPDLFEYVERGFSRPTPHYMGAPPTR